MRMDIFNLINLKRNVKKISEFLGDWYFDYFGQIICENHDDIDNTLVTFKWSQVEVIIRLSLLAVEQDFLYGFLFDHIDKSKPVLSVSDFKNNIFSDDVTAVKYTKKALMVNKTTITRNKKTHSFYIQSEFIGRENYTPYKKTLHTDQSIRKIKEGVIFGNYLFSQPEEKRLDILINFYDWLFRKYKTKDKNKVSNILLDCHLWNFLKTKNSYFYFDRDVILTENIEKSYVFYYALYINEYLDWYYYLLKHYKVEDKSDYYIKNPLCSLPESLIGHIKQVKARDKYILSR